MSTIHSSKKTIYSIIIGSAVFCFLFVCFAIGVDWYFRDLPFEWQSLYVLYKLNKVLWVVLFVPFPFLLFIYYLVKFIQKNNFALRKSAEYEREKSEQILAFVEKLRNGETNAALEMKDKEDELALSLINLRDELRKNKEEETLRKKQDAQRHWSTEGVAKFGAILRENSNNLDQLAYNVISNLVRYVEAKQAGFYIINEEKDGKKYFDLISCFAYDRKKYSEQRIEWGESLVGACTLERQTVYLKDVPDNYVNITSGLGKANPRCVLLVPLKTADEVYGVIELASFKIFEDFEIEFIEKIAESIASTISSVKINMRTAKLLDESRGQAEILAHQEEEMRNNMEELKITQIEAAQQAEQFISFTNSVNHTLIRAEYSTNGNLLYANTKFLEKLGYSNNSEVEGKPITMFISKKDREWFDKLWENLTKGGKHFEGDMKHVTKQGTDVWTMATYVSVRDQNGNPQKILFLGIDTTEAKKQSLDYKGQIDALNRSSLKAEYLPSGEIIDVNKKLLDVLHLSADEVLGKNVLDFIPKEDLDEFKVIWENVVNGASFEGREKRVTKDSEERWFHGTYSVVLDIYGEIAKIVYIANDITEQKRIENQNKGQTETLKVQEEKLQQAKVELSKKLKETREEMKVQFKETETIKLLNEKTLEGLLDAVVSINQDNQISFFNKAAEEVWGLSRHEVLNANVEIILPSEYAEKAENYMGKYFKAGQRDLLGARTEVYIVDKYGEKVNVLVTFSEAQISGRYSLTAFVQKIEVELF